MERVDGQPRPDQGPPKRPEPLEGLLTDAGGPAYGAACWPPVPHFRASGCSRLGADLDRPSSVGSRWGRHFSRLTIECRTVNRLLFVYFNDEVHVQEPFPHKSPKGAAA